MGLDAIIEALPALSIADKKALISETFKSIREEKTKDESEECSRLFALCQKAIYASDHRIEEGTLYDGTRTRLYSTARQIIDYHIFVERGFERPTMEKVMGRSFFSITHSSRVIADYLSLPKMYPEECSLYHMFKFKLKEYETK